MRHEGGAHICPSGCAATFNVLCCCMIPRDATLPSLEWATVCVTLAALLLASVSAMRC